MMDGQAAGEERRRLGMSLREVGKDTDEAQGSTEHS